MLPALHSGVIPPELSSPIESALVQTGHTQHPSESLSSLATTPSDIALQVTVALDADVTTSNGALSTHDMAGDLAHSTLTEASRTEDQSPLSNPDIAEHTTRMG
jgi:hypothetical protein